MMEKKSCNCAETIKQLKRDRERLAEENSNILTISSDHKRINGELQVKLTEAEKKIKYFEENYIKIDGKK
ncbi:hypothetical protein [uncultured Mediterranean phage uvMED]|nr:hypothetical protein [uncultured Mediterranean phage uvMED]